MRVAHRLRVRCLSPPVTVCAHVRASIRWQVSTASPPSPVFTSDAERLCSCCLPGPLCPSYLYLVSKSPLPFSKAQFKDLLLLKPLALPPLSPTTRNVFLLQVHSISYGPGSCEDRQGLSDSAVSPQSLALSKRFILICRPFNSIYFRLI